MKNRLKKVENFWNKNLCGAHFVDSEYLSKEFFDSYRNFRFKKEHHLNYYIDWESAKNKNVLEIGVGVGADSTRWARFAKTFVGMDLTSEAVFATKQHFQHLFLEGFFIKGNAESLPFFNEKFDIVYSHGVLHHTPHIEISLTEINRVLKPHGKIILMLYSKSSVNYWFRIQFYFRLRFLVEIFRYKLKFKVKSPWIDHINNFHKFGWTYFAWRNWPQHCTDGPNCPIANIYYKYEMKNILKKSGFRITKLRKAHLPLGISSSIERFLAKYLGFFQFVWAEKRIGNNVFVNQLGSKK